MHSITKIIKNGFPDLSISEAYHYLINTLKVQYGDGEAAYHLGCIYEAGLNDIPQDKIGSFEWFYFSAWASYKPSIRGCCRIGDILYSSRGV